MREIRKHISEVISDHEEIQAGLGVLLRLLRRLDEVAFGFDSTTLLGVPRHLGGSFDETLRRLVMGIRAADKPKRVGNLPAVEEDAAISPEADQDEPGLIVFKKIGNEVFSDNDRLKKTLAPLVGKKLPLVPLLGLKQVRSVLLQEFPHAGSIIDAIMADLMTRKSVALRPTVLTGLPGCWGAGDSVWLRRYRRFLVCRHGAAMVEWRAGIAGRGDHQRKRCEPPVHS
jgi:hypothetical protein